MLFQNHGFKVCRHYSVQQFIEDQENENTRKKTQQNVALLKEFLTLRNESRLIIEIFPKKLNADIDEFIITVRKKDSKEGFLRSLMASFERYLKKKNYRFSIMKDAEFEQAHKALQSKQKDLKQKGKRNNLTLHLLSRTRSTSVFVGLRSTGMCVGVTSNYSKLQMERNF